MLDFYHTLFINTLSAKKINSYSSVQYVIQEKRAARASSSNNTRYQHFAIAHAPFGIRHFLEFPNASGKVSQKLTENGNAPASPPYKVCRKRPESRQQAKLSPPPGNGRLFPILRALLTGSTRPHRHRRSCLASSPGSARRRAELLSGRLPVGANGRAVPKPGRRRAPAAHRCAVSCRPPVPPPGTPHGR